MLVKIIQILRQQIIQENENKHKTTFSKFENMLSPYVFRSYFVFLNCVY